MARRLKNVLTGIAFCWALTAVGLALRGSPTLAAKPAQAPAEKPAGLSPAPVAAPAADDETDVLGSNAGCYVCHTTFVKEDLALVHLKNKVGCIKCHGVSDKHANDEHVGATKPDITFKRPQIDANCVACHDTHDAPAKAVVARFLERRLAAGTAPVCTDCHGTHKIDRSAAEKGTGARD